MGEYILTYGDADSGFVFVENEADDTFTNYEPQRLSLTEVLRIEGTVIFCLTHWGQVGEIWLLEVL